MRLLKNWWFVTIACALLMALLLAAGLPLFVGFLRPWWVRLLCVLLVGGVWGTLAFLRRRKAQQASRALGEELAPSAEDEEDRALGQRMRDALAQMKGLRASGGIISTRGPGMSSSARRGGQDDGAAQFRPALSLQRQRGQGRGRHAQPRFLVRR
jgi:type VI protein secretion system component VasK